MLLGKPEAQLVGFVCKRSRKDKKESILRGSQ